MNILCVKCGLFNGCKNKHPHRKEKIMILGFAPVKRPTLPKIGCDIDGIVAKPKTPKLFGIPVGCDLPEQGGIGGNLGKSMPKPPYVCYLA